MLSCSLLGYRHCDISIFESSIYIPRAWYAISTLLANLDRPEIHLSDESGITQLRCRIQTTRFSTEYHYVKYIL